MPEWQRFSNGSGGNQCVEVKLIAMAFEDENPSEVWVRDSKDPGGPVLKFTRKEWESFMQGAKLGHFDFA